MLKRRHGTLGLLALFAVAAAPSTRPADRDTLEVTAPDVHLHFRVPRSWQHKPVPGPLAGKVFVFDPAPPSKKGSNFLQMIQIYLDHPKPTQKTIDDVVADLKAALLKQTLALKFVKDGPLPFAGRQAWELQWLQQSKGHVAGSDPPQTVTLEFDRCEILWLEHDTLCEFGFHADEGFLPSLVKKAESVAKTLVWD